jgi:hypothetical protein
VNRGFKEVEVKLYIHWHKAIISIYILWKLLQICALIIFTFVRAHAYVIMLYIIQGFKHNRALIVESCVRCIIAHFQWANWVESTHFDPVPSFTSAAPSWDHEGMTEFTCMLPLNCWGIASSSEYRYDAGFDIPVLNLKVHSTLLWIMGSRMNLRDIRGLRKHVVKREVWSSFSSQWKPYGRYTL